MKVARELLKIARELVAPQVAGVRDHLERSLGRPVNVRSQGKAICEEQKHGEYLVMFPNGFVEHAMNRAQAEQKVKSWFHDNGKGGDVGVGLIEWR